MPVRIVPKNYRNLTGLVPNSRTQAMTAFESTLERDFLLLLDFDPDVEFYEEQPLKITYPDEAGQRRTYTPDVLVRYRTERLEIGRSKPHLCEVKYRDRSPPTLDRIPPQIPCCPTLCPSAGLAIPFGHRAPR